ATYSYAEPDGDVATIFQVPGKGNAVLGFENWKAALRGTLKVFDGSVFISPTIIYIGPRYGYAYSAAVNDLDLKKFDETVMINLVLEKRDFMKNTHLTVGLYNILDEDYRII